MLDGWIRTKIDPYLNQCAAHLARYPISANQMTMIGLALGLCAALLIALIGPNMAALVVMLLSRLADGLDGAIARQTQKTDFGGYLDIFCDFIFYSLIPFAFIWHNPAQNALAGAFLLGSFYINAASFFGYALLAQKHHLHTDRAGIKSFYFSKGLLEGSETIIFFCIICLFPAYFPAFSWVFAVLCLITALTRLLNARHVFAK